MKSWKKGWASLTAASVLFTALSSSWAQASLWEDRRESRLAMRAGGGEGGMSSLTSLPMARVTRGLEATPLDGSDDPARAPVSPFLARHPAAHPIPPPTAV